MSRQPSRRWTGERVFPYLAVAPAFVMMTLVLAYPMAQMAIISVLRYNLRNMLGPKPFVGLENYRFLLTLPDFWPSFARTLYFVFWGLAVEMVLSLGLALVVSRDFLGVGLARSIIMLPWMTSTAATAVTWGWLLEGSFGAVNYILLGLGIIRQPVLWLGTYGLTMNVLIAIDVWREVPVMTMMLVAGLQSIPGELFEAARIDGAGPLAIFALITMPLLVPTIMLVLTLRTMIALRVFDLVAILTAGGPGGSTEVIGTYIYRNAFSRFDFGAAAALSVILFVVTLVISLFYLRTLDRHREANA
jgi:multiple sugar transport system permease protein